MTAILPPILCLLGGTFLTAVFFSIRARRQRPSQERLRAAVERCLPTLGKNAAGDSSEDPLARAARVLDLAGEGLAATRADLARREEELARALDTSRRSREDVLRCVGDVERLFEESRQLTNSIWRETRHFAAAAAEIATLVSESTQVSTRNAEEQEKGTIVGERIAEVVRELQRSIGADSPQNRDVDTLASACGELVEEGARRAGERSELLRRQAGRGEDLRAAAQRVASRGLEFRHMLADIEKGTGNLLSIVLQAGDDLEELGRRSNEIRSILDYLGDVAEETNLLALNAAIIAAEAGPEGRGFGVVAEEIRELSERTGSSTREVTGLLESVYERVRSAEAGFRKGCEHSAGARDLVHRAAGDLEELVRDAGRVASVAGDLVLSGGEEGTAQPSPWEAVTALLEALKSGRAQREHDQAHARDLVGRLEKAAAAVVESVTRQSESTAQISGTFIRLHDLIAPLQKLADHQRRYQEESADQLARFRHLTEQLHWTLRAASAPEPPADRDPARPGAGGSPERATAGAAS